MMKDTNQLINSITPFYNQYKSQKDSITGTKALEIMWEIGDLLKSYIEEHSIKPHTLYRIIYGKGEGTSNITQKSYIPREFQGRCYRIRNIFKQKHNIAEMLPNLKSFTCFREAMPFFDNEKYILKGAEKVELLKLLNSDITSKDIISLLPKNRIGKKNPRTQKLHELDSEKKAFIDFYNMIYKLIKYQDYNIARKELTYIDNSLIRTIARNTSALSQDGLKFFDLAKTKDLPELWSQYLGIIRSFSEEKNPKRIRRFRRIISPERIVRLADMLFALLSESNYKRFR